MALRTNQVQDVKPGARDIMEGIDGLYWYKGSLAGVEYGTGAYRVVRWRLSSRWGRGEVQRDVGAWNANASQTDDRGDHGREILFHGKHRYRKS
jgi:hypothetical protein